MSRIVIPDTVREHRERKAAQMAELSEAFAPCDITSLATRLWDAYGKRSELEKEIATLRQVLTAWCGKHGEVIGVEGVPPLRPVRVITEYDAVRGTFREETTIRFDDTRRQAWVEKQKGEGLNEQSSQACRGTGVDEGRADWRRRGVG